MHERSLVRVLLRQVERLMLEHGAARVVAVHVRIGELSGVEPELVRLAFEASVEATPMRGARLTIVQDPLQAQCDRCQQRFVMERFRFECPRCAGRQVTVLRGEDLLLESVTLEQADG